MKVKEKIFNFERKNHLSEYTDDELHEIIMNNENIDTAALACICSEKIRRDWEFIEKMKKKIRGKNEIQNN
jgi:hypothetical protein